MIRLRKIEGKEIKEDTPGKQYFKGSWDNYSHDIQKINLQVEGTHRSDFRLS